MTDWNSERDKLKDLVKSGKIKNATRSELLHWLLALTNANPPYLIENIFNQENADWKHIIDKLLEKHGTERAETLANRAVWISVPAAIFTALAAIFTGLQAHYAYQTLHAENTPSAAGKTSAQLESTGSTNKPPAQFPVSASKPASIAKPAASSMGGSNSTVQ